MKITCNPANLGASKDTFYLNEASPGLYESIRNNDGSVYRFLVVKGNYEKFIICIDADLKVVTTKEVSCLVRPSNTPLNITIDPNS